MHMFFKQTMTTYSCTHQLFNLKLNSSRIWNNYNLRNLSSRKKVELPSIIQKSNFRPNNYNLSIAKVFRSQVENRTKVENFWID